MPELPPVMGQSAEENKDEAAREIIHEPSKLEQLSKELGFDPSVLDQFLGDSEILTQAAKEGESPHQTARRLIVELYISAGGPSPEYQQVRDAFMAAAEQHLSTLTDMQEFDNQRIGYLLYQAAYFQECGNLAALGERLQDAGMLANQMQQYDDLDKIINNWPEEVREALDEMYN